MKKVLAVLLVCFVVMLALLGALSVFPHVHGNDFDHSAHKSCPVYQFSLHESGAIVVMFCFFVVPFFVGYLTRVKQRLSVQPSCPFAPLRAPPALF